ncbi:hypothetical protein [Bdellovibrio reynosensis]|uniref:Uncharacterized protein n=1 Tax=Bdellovibrio reynosensis TaxID=2835041 RepID=A0ABY4C8S2_9BACT|nr:hypothetical protein [Bdellovibrio reynosensis]UOF01387.1 hypothetical protein MNR06_00275 [Bdellovibrio reynosensis]
MATIQCKVEVPAVEGLNENEITVGREILLACEGEFPKNLDQEKLHFVLKPEMKYKIHLLKFEFRSSTAADITATAYKAGEIQIDDLQLSDGTQTLSLGAIQYGVQSVLPKQAPGAPEVKQEPFGPFGPAQLSVPMLYWAMLAAFIGLVILLVVAKIYRVVQRRNMLQRLKEHDSALSPLAQFHQSFRKLQRINSVFFGVAASKEDIQTCLEDTNKMLKLFLTRRYQVPALEWNDRLILKDLKKHHPKVHQHFGDDLKKLLNEYSRGFQDKENLKEQDVLNIATSTRHLVEEMERMS